MQKRNATSQLTIRCVGDIAPVRGTVEALKNTGATEFSRRLSGSLPRADLTLGNLEAPVVAEGKRRENKRYNVRTDAAALDLIGSGNVVSLANNHIMDFGEEGLAGTIAALDASGIIHAGAGRNLEEARKPALIDVGGLNVGVLCCADPRFQAATVDRAGTCPASAELVDAAVRDLRRSAEVVIVSVHMGIEFFPVPSRRQLALAEVCARAGASLLQFHHAHTISGVQNIGACTVLFGTGNFVFPYILAAGHRRAWHRTAVWTVDVALDQRKPVATSVSWVPMLLDNAGLPAPAPRKTATRIDKEIKRWSKRIERRTALPRWRLLYVFRPGYLWLALVNYGDMVRRQGLAHTAREIGRALRASFMGDSSKGKSGQTEGRSPAG